MDKTKPTLREELKIRRLALSQKDRQQFSQAINKRLIDSQDWTKVKSLHFYEPIEALGEVNIAGFMDKIKTNYPKIKLFTSSQFNSSWQVCSFDGKLVQELKADVIIVPMLGFDKSLQRLGYGGGYYDKFLSTQPQALKIGVSFEIGKTKSLPTEAHDIAMDQIITEERVYLR